MRPGNPRRACGYPDALPGKISDGGAGSAQRFKPTKEAAYIQYFPQKREKRLENPPLKLYNEATIEYSEEESGRDCVYAAPKGMSQETLRQKDRFWTKLWKAG